MISGVATARCQPVTGWTSMALVQLVVEHVVDVIGLIPGPLVGRHVPVKTEEPPPSPLGSGCFRGKSR